jgi:hypothetical protein
LKIRPEIEWLKQDGDHLITGPKYVEFSNGFDIWMCGIKMFTVLSLATFYLSLLIFASVKKFRDLMFAAISL